MQGAMALLPGLVDHPKTLQRLKICQQLLAKGKDVYKRQPHGLCGNDLTISERIVAIGDITSALLGKRSYKEKMSHDKTMQILHQMGEQGELDIDIINFLKEYQNVIFKRASTSGDHVYMPVSYTHLDVYKRQVMKDASVRISKYLAMKPKSSTGFVTMP